MKTHASVKVSHQSYLEQAYIVMTNNNFCLKHENIKRQNN